MGIWNTVRTIVIFYDHLVEHFALIWYILSGFGITHQKKSGNPVRNLHRRIKWPQNVGCLRNFLNSSLLVNALPNACTQIVMIRQNQQRFWVLGILVSKLLARTCEFTLHRSPATVDYLVFIL
jgi:hypothetical protein